MVIDKDISAYLNKASDETKEALVEIARALSRKDVVFELVDADPISVRAISALMNKEALAEMYLESLTNGIPKRRGRPRGSKTRKKAEPRRQPDAVVAGPGAAD